MLEPYTSMLGRVCIGHFDDDGNLIGELTPMKSNLVTFDGTEVLSRILAGQSEYKIAGVYFEFENAAAPVLPSFDRTTGIADFQGLAAPKDYIRETLSAVPTITTGDSSGSGNPYENNRANFFALTAADQGENGVAFNAASDSQIVSVGLVAMPESGDPSKDILYARFVPASAFPKVAGRNPGITWTAEFL